MLEDFNIKIGINPIIWTNDDFEDLGGEIPLEDCLSEMKKADYEGTELGRKFPKEAENLKNTLMEYGLELVSGWHSTYLATNTFESEKEKFLSHMKRIKYCGSDFIILAECSYDIHSDPQKPLKFEDAKILDDKEWKNLISGLEEFSRIAKNKDMKCVYHHHMGTVIQNQKEIDHLMDDTNELMLLADTGHMAVAGIDPLQNFIKYGSRIGHVHLKNIRSEIVDKTQKENWSFEQAVRSGIFTVPGDGGLDYIPIFKQLKESNYKGWLVVEAEQDPTKANPLEYAAKAREYLKNTIGK